MTNAEAHPTIKFQAIKTMYRRSRFGTNGLVTHDEIPVTDYRVLIDGEYRAVFRTRKRSGYAGYEFRDANGAHIRGDWRRMPRDQDIIKDNFASIVREHLNAIPTIAELERARLIEQAERENREWDKARDEHRAQIRREVLRSALMHYVEGNCNKPPLVTLEHLETAKAILKQMEDRLT